MLCNISLNTSVACSIVCFPGVTSSLAKVNKSSGAHFLALFLKFPNFLMLLNIQIDLLILKTYYGQFTLTTKKSLHIIFKAVLGKNFQVPSKTGPKMAVLGAKGGLTFIRWFYDPQKAHPCTERRLLAYFLSKSVRASQP